MFISMTDTKSQTNLQIDKLLNILIFELFIFIKMAPFFKRARVSDSEEVNLFALNDFD